MRPDARLSRTTAHLPPDCSWANWSLLAAVRTGCSDARAGHRNDGDARLPSSRPAAELVGVVRVCKTRPLMLSVNFPVASFQMNTNSEMPEPHPAADFDRTAGETLSWMCHVSIALQISSYGLCEQAPVRSPCELSSPRKEQ